MEEDIPIASIY